MNDFIPPFRGDLLVIPYNEDNNEYVLITDRMEYADSEVILTAELYLLLNSFGGNIRYSELGSYLGLEDKILIEKLIQNIKSLDDAGFLESATFSKIKANVDSEYIKLKNRPYICAPDSYPVEISKLNNFLDRLFNSDEKKYSNAKGIIVPHIDLRSENESHKIYASAYNSLKESDFETIFIIGTAHYKSTDYFMFSNKNYSTPLGAQETDFKFLDLWNKESGNKLHFNEFAHKPEHSIEYHVLLSQYFFNDKKFKIVPILAGSFYDHIISGTFPENDSDFSNLINSFKRAYEQYNKKSIFIASVDFSHIGRKFGDDYDAETKLTEIYNEDKKLIDHIINLDKTSFLKKIILDCDKYKICGTSPIYSTLCLHDFKKAEFLGYNQVNDINTKSAVSFASISLY